jgi:epoxyqueuosine reductase
LERAADTIAPYGATSAADRSDPGGRFAGLKPRLRERARELGLAEIGFTGAEPLPRGDYYETWLREGRAASMRWLEPGSRTDPADLLPGARTMIVAMAVYSRAASEPAPIAAYAQRADYHHELKRALRHLAADLRELVPSSRTRVAVDTAPIREREAAMRAGLGWIGKNTMVVNERHGCHTLLGAVLWSEEIEPDPPAADHCGGCRRCLDACPTGAFPRPYELDSRLCLSYLTIEHRDAIPGELREPLSTRAFGCDACIAACPYGARAPLEGDGLLATDAALAGRSLRELIELARDRFWKTFRHTPVERARKRGLLRNLLVAAGNSGDRALLDVVGPFVHDDDELLAEHARWAVRRLEAEGAR